MDLQHTHQNGASCLACDVASVRFDLDPDGYEPRTGPGIDELARITAALANVKHLEEAARLLRYGEHGFDHEPIAEHYNEQLSDWLDAERARKGKT